jgi:hypothetical protein
MINGFFEEMQLEISAFTLIAPPRSADEKNKNSEVELCSGKILLYSFPIKTNGSVPANSNLLFSNAFL